MQQFPQDLPLATVLVVTACIVAILYWLYRRYRVRRPKKDPAK